MRLLRPRRRQSVSQCRNFWSRDRGIAEPIVHIAIRYLHPLPPNLSLAEATLIETLATGRGADIVIDTVGGAETLHAGIAMLRPGGVFLSFSLSHVAFADAFPL